jgi:hypothetical protein
VDQVNDRKFDDYGRSKNTDDLFAGLTCQWEKKKKVEIVSSSCS